jgi:hypothetical protein
MGQLAKKTMQDAEKAAGGKTSAVPAPKAKSAMAKSVAAAGADLASAKKALAALGPKANASKIAEVISGPLEASLKAQYGEDLALALTRQKGGGATAAESEIRAAVAKLRGTAGGLLKENDLIANKIIKLLSKGIR